MIARGSEAYNVAHELCLLARTFAVLIGIAFLAQMAASKQQESVTKTTIFAAPDGAFQFSYPSDFEVCTRGNVDPCVKTYIPVCEGNSIVCVVYPAKQFGDTSFGAASFQVKELVRPNTYMTPDICVTPYAQQGGSGWPLSGRMSIGERASFA